MQLSIVGEVIKVLLIEDAPQDASLFVHLMDANQYRSFPELTYTVTTVTSMSEAVAVIEKGGVAVIVVDLLLQGTTPKDILSLIERTSSKIPIVALTTEGNIDAAIEAIRHGAQDYLVKEGTSSNAIDRSLRYAIERKRLIEEQARIRDELRRSNADLERFSTTVSHDLKEPLRMITSFLGLLEKRSSKDMDEKSREYLAFAMEGAERMMTMVNDLLAYSRIWRKERVKAAVPMEEALATAMADLKAAAEESGASITHDPLPSVNADRGQMVLLLKNLVGNAIKYRSKAAPQVHVSARRGDDGWTFSVRDNGIGIDPRDKDRLFQMFSRLHTHDEYPGTGVGLAIAKAIVERHGGMIWVESEVGKGSTFYFTMPASLNGTGN